MTPDALLGELDGLRALARALVQGDADADDLLQDTALAVLEHRGEVATDRPVRPWLGAVLRNRWRMDRRSAARRRAREQASVDSGERDAISDSIDRARTLERLAAALVALDEPFRTTVLRRYLDGNSSAELARALGIPAATVRWRLRTALARLRAALDQTSPRWHGAFIPLLGATVKAKTSISVVVVLILLLAGVGGAVWLTRDRPATEPPAAAASHTPSVVPRVTAPRSAVVVAAPLVDPLPGQGRAVVEPSDAEGGVISGRVINWSRGDGVAGAELTFTSDAGAQTVRTRDDGSFELAPPQPGRFLLSAIAAPGFLPYAPELSHSTVHVALARGQAVRGITVFLFPALDYQGTVVDAHGAPVAGARIRLLDAPAGEQAIDRQDTEWTSDAAGRFTFHAADGAVLEAVRGSARGWARLDGDVAITKQMTIALGNAPARDAAITGRAIDETGAPVADALIRAVPAGLPRTPAPPTAEVRAGAFATTGPDGGFTLAGLDHKRYDVSAELEDRAPETLSGVPGGSQAITLTLEAGHQLAGSVVDGNGKPCPSFTLLVFRRAGAMRVLVAERSLVDPLGRFAIRVAKGDYELMASAGGWAPSERTPASADATDIKLALSAGATLRGTVVASEDGSPLPYARIMRESRSGGASIQPANAGTVTRADGTFELTGIPPGQLSIMVSAADYNPRIEAGMTADDGQTLGPITVALSKLLPGEQPKVELIGIGVALTADGDDLTVTRVVPGGGAEAVGIVAGDHITAIDGQPVAPLGVDGAVAKIRGVEGTTLAVTLRRGDQTIQLVVTRRKLRA